MTSVASGPVELPPWAVVSTKRREHIGRVVSLLSAWSDAMHLAPTERQMWLDAGRWHDALRDADESVLRALTGERKLPAAMLHGPAAADRLADEGEGRREVLEAIRWHTVGCATWSRVGRALYMADFLEPGRSFMKLDRAYLAAAVPSTFDDTFRQVVRLRIEWTVREGRALGDETVTLWNSLQ